jgi:alpha-1,2-rhamnosyltransferase
VQKDVERYIEHNGLLPVGRSIIIDHFHLGADFSPPEAGSVRASLQEVFGEEPVYLIVSTIEPRKNHVYLIDAFDRLWDRGVRVRLLIVGRVGWKVDALMQRLRTHPLRDKALFLFHDLSDAELAHAYRHAKALVFPSHVEGFGLPIIEAMQHGLPVIVSDIPVHREVAGERACFVSLDDTQSLVDCIESIETNGMPDTCRPDADFHWLTWRESTHQLLRKIVRIGEQARQRA